MQVTNWPDHSIPEDLESIRNVINYIMNKSHYPIVVHCSAGLGRTGTFIAIYNIIRTIQILMNSGRKPCFSVFNTVRKLREQRMGMVTSIDQYKFIYDYCVNYLCQINSNIV